MLFQSAVSAAVSFPIAEQYLQCSQLHVLATRNISECFSGFMQDCSAQKCIGLLPLMQALSRLEAGEKARHIRVQISMQNAAARNALDYEAARPELALLPFLLQKHRIREALAMPSTSSQRSTRPSSATQCATGPYAVPLGEMYATVVGALASSQP